MICHLEMIPSWLWSTIEVVVSSLFYVPLPKYWLAISFLWCLWHITLILLSFIFLFKKLCSILFILIFIFLFVLKLYIIYAYHQSFFSSFQGHLLVFWSSFFKFARGRTHNKNIPWFVAKPNSLSLTCLPEYWLGSV